jgi:hypothetical protein
MTSKTNPTDSVDVFSLPVHPWAARSRCRLCVFTAGDGSLQRIQVGVIPNT